MSIQKRLARLEPAKCPRCLRPAHVFVGRYKLICLSCERSLTDADGGQTPVATRSAS